jgi:hypothetical protein
MAAHEAKCSVLAFRIPKPGKFFKSGSNFTRDIYSFSSQLIRENPCMYSVFRLSCV